jgi:hypothetical protein
VDPRVAVAKRKIPTPGSSLTLIIPLLLVTILTEVFTVIEARPIVMILFFLSLWSLQSVMNLGLCFTVY